MYFNQNIHRRFIVLIFFFSLTVEAKAESLFGTSENSIGFLQLPYSAAGLSKSYELAAADSLQLNFLNFSLWSQIPHTTYSVMAGYKAAFGDDGIKSNYFSDLANFQGGYLGIPIQSKRMVLGFGLQPVSFIERRYSDNLEEDLQETIYIRGGLSRAALNFSYSISRRIGLGIGYEYTFGKITDNYKIEEPGVTVSRIGFEYEYRFYGHGLVISSFVKPRSNLTFGLVVRPAVTTSVRIKGFSNSTEVNRSQLDEITLPLQLDLGLEYKIRPRLHLGFDFLYQDWQSGYKVNNSSAALNHDKFYRFGVGLERTSSERRFIKLTEQLDYRFGLFYGNLNQKSNNSSVKEYGLSFGLSLPIQRFVSKIDLAGMIGKRGDLSRNAYEETFFSVALTISVNELWFVNIDE